MKLIRIFFILLFTIFSYAQDQNMSNERQNTYIDIVSNLDNTLIELDGIELGVAPLKNILIKPNMEHNITAFNDDEYHEKNITKRVSLAVNELQTIDFQFQPLKTEVFLVGEDGELYINGKYEKMLHGNNRVLKLDAAPNILFGIYNKEKQTQFKKDLKADEFTQIKYELSSIPEEIRLYTTFVGNLIWEDTKEATTTDIDYAAAKRYCENLELAYLKDWRVPSIDELNTLYASYKDKIYNGHGEPFYWSSNTSQGDSGIWNYTEVKNFTVDGEVKKSIQEFEKGKIRCVHDVLYSDIAEEMKVEKDDTAEDTDMQNESEPKEPEPGEYDPNLTKDLQRFMLK